MKHGKVCDVMIEGLIMCRMECKLNDAYVQSVITCTQTLTLEWMNKVKLSKKGVLEWTLFVSRDETLSRNPTTS